MACEGEQIIVTETVVVLPGVEASRQALKISELATGSWAVAQEQQRGFEDR